MAKAANPTTASAMTTPAQIERLGGYLHKLRLQKCAERLEALLTELRAFYLANPELVDDILTGVLWTPDSVQDRSDLAAWIMLTRVLVNTPDFLKL